MNEDKPIDIPDKCINKKCNFAPAPMSLWFARIYGEKRVMLKLYCAKCKQSFSVAKGVVPKEKKTILPTKENETSIISGSNQ